jgi:hypothetical protein
MVLLLCPFPKGVALAHGMVLLLCPFPKGVALAHCMVLGLRVGAGLSIKAEWMPPCVHLSSFRSTTEAFTVEFERKGP